MKEKPGNRESPTGFKRPAIRRIAQALVLFVLWVVLSGHIVAEFLVVGMIGALLTVAITEWVFRNTYENGFSPAGPGSDLGTLFRILWKLLWYIPWLIIQIVVSSLQVAFVVLHPRRPIEPSLVRFNTSLTSEFAQVLFAQSITLTPGTVTVDLSDGQFIVHCLSKNSRSGIENGQMQKRIAAIFGDNSPANIEVFDVGSTDEVRC